MSKKAENFPALQQPHPQRFGDLDSQSPLAIRGLGFCSKALDAFYSRVVPRPSLMDSGALLCAQLNLPQAATCSETPSLLHEGLSLGKSLQKAPPQEAKMTGVARGDLEDIHPQPH